jgi:hypothetical protein
VDTRLREARVLQAIDLDDDGDIDIAAADAEFVSTLLNQGDAHFDPPDPTELAGVMAFADLSGDLLPDAILESGKGDCGEVDGPFPITSVALGRASGFGREDCPIGTATAAETDVNDDGLVDLVFVDGNDIVVRLRNSEGFTEPQRSGFGDLESIAWPRLARDFTGDGNGDVLTDNGDSIILHVAAGDGSFNDGRATPFNAAATAAAAGDLDDDGDVDFVEGASGDFTARVFFNDGAGDFGDALEVDMSDGDFSRNDKPGIENIVIVDFDGDSKNDVVAITTPYFLQPNGSVCLNEGKGKFAPRLDYEDFLGVGRLATGDLDGDNKDDLIAATDEGKLRLYLSSR